MNASGEAPLLATTVSGDGVPVLAVHGFTGCAETMLPLASRLDGYRCIAVDLLGHGRSPSPADRSCYGVEAMARLLAEVAAAQPDGPPHVIGYSMGGRLALALAVTYPEACRSLTLISATAGIADPTERAQRRETDEALGRQIDDVGMARFVEDWMALPMWNTLRSRLSAAEWEASMRQRMTCNPVGLANSLRAAGTGSMTPLWDRLGGLDVPTLVLCGALDNKFVDLGRDMAALLPRSELIVVHDAGHAVHLEDPGGCAFAIRQHLADH